MPNAIYYVDRDRFYDLFILIKLITIKSYAILPSKLLFVIWRFT